jgi:hypothetical protein
VARSLFAAIRFLTVAAEAARNAPAERSYVAWRAWLDAVEDVFARADDAWSQLHELLADNG